MWKVQNMDQYISLETSYYLNTASAFFIGLLEQFMLQLMPFTFGHRGVLQVIL